MAFSVVAAVVAAVALAAPAPAKAAATPAERGEQLLAGARRAERELEYPQAKRLLVELFSTPGVNEDTLIEGHLLAGAIERVLENDTEARLHFLYVLNRRPAWQMPETSPPKVRNFFELLREEVKAEQKPAPVTPPPPAPPPEEPSLVGPVVAGVGGAVAVLGIASAVMGEISFAEASKPFADREGGRTLALAGWAGTAVGVGVGVAGAVLWVTE
jgi:hypothetical protein